MKAAIKRNRTHLVIALFFFLLFLVPATYKIIILNYPILSKPIENLWAFELKIRFQGSECKDMIRHFLPKSEPGQSMEGILCLTKPVLYHREGKWKPRYHLER